MQKHSLCWDCANSTEWGCSWAQEFTPVDGWDAVEQKNGYMVIRCPEFDRNSYGFGLYRTQEEFLKVYKRMMERMAKQHE